MGRYKFDPATQIPSLINKVILVTGGLLLPWLRAEFDN
jgi:hypothetical protein